MSTETLTKQDQIVSKPRKNIVFLARRSELRLVKRAERPRRNEHGDVVDMIPGERLAFKEGKLEVPPTGKMRGEKGEPLESRDILDWLEGSEEKEIQTHHLYGDRLEGFWRLDEPAPAPSEQEIDKLQELAMELDVNGLTLFISQEEDGWKRPALLRSAKKSLEASTLKLAEMEAAMKAKAKPSEK